MSVVDAPRVAAALAPLREALLARARQRADRVRAEAAGAAAAAAAKAREEAASLLADAAARGAADAARDAAAERARVRREARGIVLAAQRAAYEELRRRVRAALAALRADPCYPGLVARLTVLARDRAGPGAVVVEYPAGGVVAEAPGLFVDCSLDTLGDRAVDALGAEVSGLWEL